MHLHDDAVHGRNLHIFALVELAFATRIPNLAEGPHPAAGGEILHHLCLGTHHALDSGGDPCPSHPERGPETERHNAHGHRRECRDNGRRDLVAGQVRVHEDHRTDDEGDHAACADDAEARRKRLHRQHGDAHGDEGEPGVVDGQHLQGEGAEQQANDAGDGANADAGVVELQDQRVNAHHEQDVGDVWIGDDAEQFVAPVWLDGLHFGAGGVEGSLDPGDGDGATVDGVEQLGEVCGHQIDDALLKRFIGSEIGTGTHRFLGPFDVASAQFGEASEVGRGIVDHLAPHRIGGFVRRPVVGFAVAAFLWRLGLGR